MATATDFKFGVHIAYVQAKLVHRGQKLGHVATF